MTETFELTPIGYVESTLTDLAAAPRQGDEGAPDAWLVMTPAASTGLQGLRAGDHVFVLTWLHRASRDVIRVHPRDDQARPEQGVFSTRSADRPNPIGLHRVMILELDERRVRVQGLEAIDGTPFVDIKPVLGAEPDAR